MSDISKKAKQPISDEERQRRLEAVEQAQASVALEGFVITEAEKKHAMRYVNGEITLEEYINAAVDLS